MEQKIVLGYPVVSALGEKIESVTVTRLKVKNLRGMPQTNEVEQGLYLVSKATGLVPEDLEEFDVSDYKILQDIVVRQLEGK